MNKKVLVLGASGMLGNAIYKTLLNNANSLTYGVIRSKSDEKYFNSTSIENLLIIPDITSFASLLQIISQIRPWVIINCVGVVKQIRSLEFTRNAIEINSLFPLKLKSISELLGVRVIHFSTDCVFNGTKGNYTEEDHSDCYDVYGKTKYLGEIVGENIVTIRTSIIGHELKTCHSLVDWFLSQDTMVEGYVNAIFSGLPTVVLADIIEKYLLYDESINGLFHISGHPINKYDLLNIVSKTYNKKITVVKNYSVKIDRSLNSQKFQERTGYFPNSWEENVQKMYHYSLGL